MMSEMIPDLGAQPVQVVYSRVYAALHNGEIDGAENNWPSYEAMGHYEVAPYFLKDEHTRVPELQLASEAAMEKLAKLDESFPDIVRTCGRESALTSAASGPSGRPAPRYAGMGRGGDDPFRGREDEVPGCCPPMYERFAEQGGADRPQYGKRKPHQQSPEKMGKKHEPAKRCVLSQREGML